MSGDIVSALILIVGLVVVVLNIYFLRTAKKAEKEIKEVDLSMIAEHTCPICGNVFYTYKDVDKGHCYYCDKLVEIEDSEED